MTIEAISATRPRTRVPAGRFCIELRPLARVRSLSGLALIVALVTGIHAAGAAPARRGADDGRSIKTPYGRTTRILTSEGIKDVVVPPRSRAMFGELRVVEGSEAQRSYAPIRPLVTPYGWARPLIENARLHQKILVGGKSYEVLAQADGSFHYLDKQGTTHRGIIRLPGGFQTPSGLARPIATDAGERYVLAPVSSGQAWRFVSEVEGALRYEEVAPLRTPYGTTALVEAEGRLSHRLQIGGRSYSVRQTEAGTYVYTDGAGQAHERVIHTDKGLLTPEGPAIRLATPEGDRFVLFSRHGAPRARFVSEDGSVLAEREVGLSTAYGPTEPFALNGRLAQRLKVGGKSYLVEAHAGGFRYVDGAGLAHDGVIRFRGALLTPHGLARPLLTDEGRQLVVVIPARPAWGGRAGVRYERVSIEDGAFRFEEILPIETPHGRARMVLADGKLTQRVSINQQPLRVQQRGAELAYLDEHGQAFVDHFAIDVANPRPAPSTLRRVYTPGLPELPSGPIVQIRDSQRRQTAHMTQATYDQLRDAMLETLAMYDPGTHYFIGLGSDPHPILAFLENLGGRGFATNFPASGKYPNGLDPRLLDPYVRRFIPPEVLNGSRTLVLIDQTNSGATREGTLAQIARVFEAYLARIGSPAKVKRLAFSPQTQGTDTGHIDTNKYPEIGRFLYHPYEHVVSQYPRHVLGQDRLSRLVERSPYVRFKAAMLERMKRDEKLDRFLVAASAEGQPQAVAEGR